MATCANKNLQEYKDLVSSEGEYMANFYWDKYEGDIEKIKSDVETPKNQTSLLEQKANLSERLSSFLDGLNFTTEFKDDLKDDSELNPLSLTDLIHKAILIRNDFKDEGLLKETAYVAYTMLGKKNKIRTDLIHSVENTPNYQEKFDEYQKRSPNLGEYKIKELIVVDFLADAIKNNFETPKDSYINRKSEYWGIEGSSKLEKKFKYLLLKIKFFLENLFTDTKLSEKELNDLYDDIAKDIVNNFYDKYSKDKSPDSQLANYENTLSRDAKAKEIIEFFQKSGMILTGSLALRKAGTIYRSAKEDLHDLDFSFELNEFKKQIGNKLITKIDIAEKLQQGIDITKEFKENLESSDLIKNIKAKYPSFKITNVFNGLGKGDLTLQGDIDGYVIDIFVYTKTQTNLSTEETSFQDWVNIFKAKLKMGRDKDIRDFVNYIPFNKSINKIASESGFRHFTFNKKQEEKPKESEQQSFYFNLSDPNYLLLSKENQKKLKDLQNKGLISSKRVSKGVNYTVPKTRTGSQSNRGIGNSEFILDVNKVKQLQNYIASNDIRWLKVSLTSNEAVVEVLPDNQWELPLKPETKDTNQDRTTTELLTKLKSIIDRLGIKLEKVDAIYEAQQEINSLNKKENKTANDIERLKTLKLQGIKKNALAMADTLNSTIQVVDDKDPKLLSEEVIHFLVDVIQQKDPTLFADMLKQSSTYSKYKQVKARYEQDGINYTEESLRKEILTHALVDYLLRDGSEIETEYQNEKSSRFWDKIKEFANNLFKSLINSDLDSFQEFFNKTLNSDYVSKEDIEGLNANKYYNIKNTLSKEALRDNFLTKKALFTAKVKVGELERYVYDGKTVKNRVSDFISKFYEDLFKNKETTKKRIDMLAAERGTIIHKIIEELFNSYVDEKTGEILKTPKPDSPQLEKFKRLNTKITAKLDTFVKEIIQEYPDALFLTEIPIINKDNTTAGTIDLIIIDKNNRVNLFDWKSKKSLYYDKTTKSWQERADIPWWNKLGWVRQIDMYVSILKENYGVNDFGKMRAIPILVKEDFSNNSVTILDLNVSPFNKSNIDIKKRELIPVISAQEKTHKTETDKLLAALHGIKETISKKLSQKSTNKDILREDLGSIENLITDLVVAESMESLIKNITLLLKNSAEFLEKRQKIIPGFTLQKDGIEQYLDYLDNLNKSQLEKEVLELNEVLKSLLIYEDLDKIKNEIFPPDSKDIVNINKNFSLLFSSIRNAISNFTLLKNTAFDKFAESNGVQNISAIDIGQNFLDQIYSKFENFYNLKFKTGALLSNILRKVDDDIREDNKRDSGIIQGFRNKFLRGFETRNASEIFKNLFHTTEDGITRLTPKIKKEFYDELEQQRKLFEEGLANSENANVFFQSTKYKEILKWIDENIDVDKYLESFNKRKEEYLNKIKESLVDEEDIVKEYILQQKEVSFEYFNNIFTSSRAFRQFAESIFVKEEKWHSDEYKKIKSNPMELEIYNYFRSLNKRAIKLGYLPGWGNMSFIPNITPTTEILRHPFAYLKGYITPNSKSVDDEEFGFSKINPITGAEEFPLKTPFTRELELNGKKLKSFDLFYAFEHFAHELNRYENLKNVEEISKAIVELEQAKTQIYEKGVNSNISNLPIKKTDDNSNYESVITAFMKYKLYGKKLPQDINIFDKISSLKSFSAFDAYVTLKSLGAHFIAAGGAFIGSYGIGLAKSGKAYSRRNFVKSTFLNVPASMDINPLHTSSIIISEAFDYRIIQKEKEELNFKRANTIKKIAILGWKYGVNVMSVVDDIIQDNTFFAALRMHRVINDKIVNPSDYRYSQNPDFYSKSKEGKNKIEKQEEAELSKHPTLYDWALKNIKNGKLDLSKLDKESVRDFNSLVKGTNKSTIGNMSSEDYYYARIGILFPLFGKFKTWAAELAKELLFKDSNFKEGVSYNKETKSASKGRLSAFISILTAFLQDKDSKSIAFIKNTINLILPLHLKNNKDLNRVMRIKYKEYVEGANTYGYEVNISEREFIDTYYTQAKALAGNLYILFALTILVGFLSGGDPDKKLKFLPDIIKRGMKELYAFLTPPTLIEFLKVGIPHAGALTDLFDIPISIIKDNSLTESLTLQYYKHFNKEGYDPYKNKIDRQNKIGKVVKETIETIPVVSNLTKTFVVPNSKEAQKFLNVDKNFREN